MFINLFNNGASAIYLWINNYKPNSNFQKEMTGECKSLEALSVYNM